MSNSALELRHQPSETVSLKEVNGNEQTNGLNGKDTYRHDNSELQDSEQDGFHGTQSPHLGKSLDGGPPVVELDEDISQPLHYRVSDVPPAHILFMSACQQTLIQISAPLSVTLIVSEVVCSQKDDVIKQQILNASMVMMGISTFLMSTFGVRLPIFQGPGVIFLVPLLAMTGFSEWQCPKIVEGTNDEDNTTMLLAEIGNGTFTPARDIMVTKIAKLSGTLVTVGVMHFLIGATGLVGILMRYIGPVTIAPTIILVGLNLYKVVVTFARPSLLVTSVTCVVNLIFSLFLANKLTPIPWWTRARGFHILWFPLHQMFSVLISIVIGWAFSAILTTAGFFTDDSSSNEYLARTDAKTNIISEAPFLDIPYPGKIAGLSFSTAAFFNFVVASFLSIFDSIGDYSACAKACRVTTPPKFAFNRGIAIEGLATVLSGGLATCHPTVSYGGSIAAIGITGIASRRVFQLCGLIVVAIGIVGKMGAFFLTIPLPVLGATTLVIIGIFVGLAVSYLEAVNLRSNRNLAIIGIALFLGFCCPYWANNYSDQINTGSKEVDMLLIILLSNPSLVGGVFSCFMDNAVPGTLKERGLLEQIRELDGETSPETSLPEKSAKYEGGRETYRMPFVPNWFRTSIFSKIIPIFDRSDSRRLCSYEE